MLTKEVKGQLIEKQQLVGEGGQGLDLSIVDLHHLGKGQEEEEAYPDEMKYGH